MDQNWETIGADGVFARDPKSGAFVVSVMRLLMHTPVPLIMAQASSEPWIVAGCLTIGPTPFALMMHQIINMRQAMTVRIVLNVKK